VSKWCVFNFLRIFITAEFTNIHKCQRWIIYMLTGLGRKNWRGGFNCLV